MLALYLIHNHIEKEDKEYFTKLFYALDCDKDGYISKKDLEIFDIELE